MSDERLMAHRKAVFLDLNGTLVLPMKQEQLDELYPIPGAVESVARLTAAGFVCPVVTVQSRISKGLFSAKEFLNWFHDFAEMLDGMMFEPRLGLAHEAVSCVQGGPAILTWWLPSKARQTS